MNTLLKQRKFLLTKVFELTHNSIKVKVSKPFSYIEEELSFEDLSTMTFRRRYPNKIYSIISLFLIIAILISTYSHFFQKNGSDFSDIMVWVVLLFIFSYFFYVTYENSINIFLSNGRYLSFYANSPGNQQVNDFIALIKSEQKKYLLDRYAQADPYLNEEQLSNNLKWLCDKKIIDDDELQDLRNRLLPKPSSGNGIGFKFNSASN